MHWGWYIFFSLVGLQLLFWFLGCLYSCKHIKYEIVQIGLDQYKIRETYETYFAGKKIGIGQRYCGYTWSEGYGDDSVYSGYTEYCFDSIEKAKKQLQEWDTTSINENFIPKVVYSKTSDI